MLIFRGAFYPPKSLKISTLAESECRQVLGPLSLRPRTLKSSLASSIKMSRGLTVADGWGILGFPKRKASGTNELFFPQTEISHSIKFQEYVERCIYLKRETYA